MIRRYNNLSFALFLPGAALQIIAMVMKERSGSEDFSPTSLLLLVVGTLMAIAGLGCYAKAKGRSPLWCLAGMLGIIGILLLSILKDESGDPWNT